jgi:hypothetical protein
VPNLTRRDARALLPQHDLPDEQLDIVILLVEGWLLDATGLDDLPNPLPTVLWAGGTELAALLVSNPESLAQKTIGPTSAAWPMASRRDAIVERIRRRYRAERMAPAGCYGDRPFVYPDPIRPAVYVGDAGSWLWVGPR